MTLTDGSFVAHTGFSNHATNTVWPVLLRQHAERRSRAPTTSPTTKPITGSAAFCFPTATAPPTPQTFRVQNHSWVGDGTGATERSILRRADYIIETDDMTMVVGANNNGNPAVLKSHPTLLVYAYNTIVAGRSDGSSFARANQQRHRRFDVRFGPLSSRHRHAVQCHEHIGRSHQFRRDDAARSRRRHRWRSQRSDQGHADGRRHQERIRQLDRSDDWAGEPVEPHPNPPPRRRLRRRRAQRLQQLLDRNRRQAVGQHEPAGGGGRLLRLGLSGSKGG